MKTNGREIWVACGLLAALVWMASPLPADSGPPAPTVRLDAVVEDTSVHLVAKANGPLEFTTHQPTGRVFLVDFVGQAPKAAIGARVLDSELVTSYRVLQYRAGSRPIVRLEILLKADASPRVERVSDQHLAVVVEAAQGAAARQAPAHRRAATATQILRVHLDQVDQEARVRIEADGRLDYRATRLSNPERLVVDFTGAKVRAAGQGIQGNGQPVRGVRMGQFKPDVARVVVDLEAPTAYKATRNGNALTIAFPAPARTADQSIGPLPLPATLTEPLAALASPVPQRAGDAGDAPTEKTAAAAAETARPMVPSAQAAQARYSGEPISVNLKDVDLKDFFRLIHEISGINVVLDPAVSGTLTIVLDDVPWDQALDIVLRNNGLERQLEGNVLRIATRETLKREAEVQRDLARAQAEATEQVVTFRTLSYAKASVVSETLKRFLSSRGEVLADERSNMLIIRDIPSVIPQLDSLITQLDRKSQQVEIEARVVAATRAFAREIGTQFGFATTADANSRNLNTIGGGVGQPGFVSPFERLTGPLPPLVVEDSGSIPLNTNLAARAPTSAISFFHSSPNLALDFILTAAENRGVGKLLSKPKVFTQNNHKGLVKQGTKIPVQTIINNTITVQFIDAVLKLEVTPQITAEGTVFMDVVVENTAIDEGVPRVNNIPALSTQSVESRITVGDGDTFVIGGVIISSQRTDVAQVPLIGSIPVIGHLFKRTSVNTQSQELLFFLTPRIVPN